MPLLCSDAMLHQHPSCLRGILPRIASQPDSHFICHGIVLFSYAHVRLYVRVYAPAHVACARLGRYGSVDLHMHIMATASVSATAAAAASGVTLDDCLKQFVISEQLSETDMWRCPNCKEEKQADKKMEIWSLPRILVVQLKRFSYNRYFRDKLTTVVDYPLENLDMSQYVLHPVGSGSVKDSGHVAMSYGLSFIWDACRGLLRGCNLFLPSSAT